MTIAVVAAVVGIVDSGVFVGGGVGVVAVIVGIVGGGVFIAGVVAVINCCWCCYCCQQNRCWVGDSLDNEFVFVSLHSRQRVCLQHESNISREEKQLIEPATS